MARPVALPYPQTDVIILQGYHGFTRATPPVCARGFVHALRNDDSVKQKTLVLYGYRNHSLNIKGSFGASKIGPGTALGILSDTAVDNRVVGAQIWEDAVESDRITLEVPVSGADLMNQDLVDGPTVTKINGTQDMIYTRAGFSLGKIQSTVMKVSIWNGNTSAWALLGSKTLDATPGMYAGSFIVAATFNRNYAVIHGGVLSYNLKFHSCKNDTTGETNHQDDVWVAQPT